MNTEMPLISCEQSAEDLVKQVIALQCGLQSGQKVIENFAYILQERVAAERYYAKSLNKLIQSQDRKFCKSN